ncbi:MAG: NAD(P)-binding protein [Gammaproteobacteria bacterium]|nr:NAD(P)-binding protein [Gammaproteobacteria bacterium]
MLDVAIIGAGAGGLGAAKAAISRGLTFKVLEAALYLGGVLGQTRTNKTHNKVTEGLFFNQVER